jgi:hypothetical protein
MAIQIRRGNQADLQVGSLSQGEPFVCLDTKVAGIKGNESPIYLATGDSAGRTPIENIDGAVPATRTIAGLALSGNITLAQLIAAGLAAGTDGKANTAALADNASQLGGHNAAEYPLISSGTWTPTILGSSVAGSPTYNSSLRSGSWLKDGKRVSLFGVISVTAFNDVSGDILLGGLPFAPAERSSGSVGWNSVPEATGKIALQLVPSEVSGNIHILKGNNAYLTTSDVTSILDGVSLLLAAICIDYLTNS